MTSMSVLFEGIRTEFNLDALQRFDSIVRVFVNGGVLDQLRVLRVARTRRVVPHSSGSDFRFAGDVYAPGSTSISTADLYLYNLPYHKHAVASCLLYRVDLVLFKQRLSNSLPVWCGGCVVTKV